MPDTKPRLLTVEEIDALADSRRFPSGAVPEDHETVAMTVGEMRSLCRQARAMAVLEARGWGLIDGTGANLRWLVIDAEGDDVADAEHAVYAIEAAEEASRG